MLLPYVPKTVAQIPIEFQLITDSQDIHATLDHIDKLDLIDDIGFLFVSVSNGDYDGIFAGGRSVPLLCAPVCKLL